MSVDNFIQAVARADADEAYANEQVVIPTFSTNYDGEVKTGNAVLVFTTELPDVQDYAANGRRFEASDIDVKPPVRVLIEDEDIVPQRIDNIDRRQALGDLTQWTSGQGKALARKVEARTIAKLIAEGTDVNTGNATVTTAAKAKSTVLGLSTALDDEEVPADGRYVLTNGAGKALLLESMSDVAVNGDNSALRRGVIGELYGFTVLHSAQIAEKAKPVFVAYHSGAVAFVGQIEESRAIPAPDGHADLLSTLLVSGSKIVHPEGTAVFVSGGRASA